MAKLYFRYGAMNSGKSTALMQVAHNYEEQGMRVLILKPQVDTKGGGELVSRLGVRRKADLLVPPGNGRVCRRCSRPLPQPRWPVFSATRASSSRPSRPRSCSWSRWS